MTDPKRLLLDESNQEERELLAAGAAEEPPADGAARLALALGSAAFDPSAQGAAHAKLWSAKLALKAGALVLAVGGALVIVTTRLPRREPVPAALPARAPLAAPASTSPALSRQGADVAAPSIADEVVRLDAVRARLVAKDSAGALSALEGYTHRYPRGTLAPEAARLRVEVMLAQGDRARAEALARDFLRAYPDSPHAPALRSLLARKPRAVHDE